MNIDLTPELAEAILEAEDVCLAEGIGPTSKEWYLLLVAVAETYPSLKEKFSHLDWSAFLEVKAHRRTERGGADE